MTHKSFVSHIIKKLAHKKESFEQLSTLTVANVQTEFDRSYRRKEILEKESTNNERIGGIVTSM